MLKKRGIDDQKKVKGRKRHIVTDTQGHFLQVTVLGANTHDTIAGCKVFEKAVQNCPNLLGVCADASYRKIMSLLPKGRGVEKTFSWINHFRSLLKDYEIATSSAENYLIIAHSLVLLNRIK